MRIAVTGATGFIGSYVVDELLARGHEVAIVVRPGSDLWRLTDLLPRVHPIRGSLNALEALRAPLEAFKPDAMAHLGWQGVGNVHRNDPVQAHNIASTVELLALCSDLGARTFVGAGSQAEYGPHSRIIAESDETHPTTLYGMAKLAAATMCGQLAAERGVRFAWMRIFSTYGPKSDESWLIPSLIRAVRKGQRMALTGCEQRWGFLHVRDAATAFRVALAAPHAHGLFNVGAPDAPLLRDTVTMLRDVMNPAVELGFGDVPYRPDQVMLLQADISRLAAFGWHPQTDLATGLRETVAWHDQQP